MKQILLIILTLICLSLTGCRLMSPPTNPQPIITITFDDADESIWGNALPIMNEYGFTATNFVPSSWLDQSGKLTWEQVEQLEFVKGWETGGHTLNHEDLGSISYIQADSIIKLDQQILRSHGLAVKSFALPGGHCPSSYFEILRNYYQNIRISQDLQLYQPIDRYTLGYCHYTDCFHSQDIIDRILRGIANHEDLIIIGFHSVKNETTGIPSNCPPDEFRKIMKWIKSHHLEVKTLGNAMDYFDQEN